MAGKISLDIREQIEKGVSLLKQGRIIAYPTDTVYGLGACVEFPEAIERIYAVKERPRNMSFPLLVSDESQIVKLAGNLSPLTRMLIRKYLPGALTLVLPASSSVPEIITGHGKTVAIRIPDHPVPLALIRGLGAPIVGTSANLSGHPSALNAEQVYDQLGDKVDFIIDGGQCPGGKESTIVDVTGAKPVILREGAIPSTELETEIQKFMQEVV